jgi:GT2 family glycosyltransferase
VLNSDIKADEDFLDPLVAHFEKSDDILFVSSRMYSFDKKTYQGDRSRPKVRFGVISADICYKGYEKFIKEEGYAFSAGNGIFDRKKFLKLGGFDSIYIPGRYEDVDLCYRGWKSGLKGIYEPKSILYHKGYGTFCKEYNDRQIHGLVFKNSLIFTCKNITDKFMLMKMFIWLIPRLIFFIFTLRFFFVRYFFQFLLKLPFVLKRRQAAQVGFKITDKELLQIFKDS